MRPQINLVFIHGYGGGPEDWDNLRECLGSQLQQTVITLPAHGDHQSGERLFTIERCATDILETLDKPPAILIGHSMGTRIALEIASRRPDLISGLVLVDGSNAPASRQEITTEFQERVARLGYEKAMDWTLSSILVDGIPPEIRKKMYARISALPPDAALEYELSMAQWDRDLFRKRLSGFTEPVTVVQSTSLVPSQGWARKHVSEFPNSLWLDNWRQVSSAKIHLVDGCGHYVMIEKPNTVSETIISMIATSGLSTDHGI